MKRYGFFEESTGHGERTVFRELGPNDKRGYYLASEVDELLGRIQVEARQQSPFTMANISRLIIRARGDQPLDEGIREQQATATIQAQRRKIERLERALWELHGAVKGECPSLLNEDSGGDGRLEIEIEELLRASNQSSAGDK